MTKTFVLIPGNLLKPGKQAAHCKKGCRWLVGLLLPALLLVTGLTNKLYADVTLTSVAVPAADMNQGTNNNLIHITQMQVTTTAVTVNNVQFTLAGTFDNNDLATVLVYFNGTVPTFAGSTFLGSAVATFAAPHSYSINITRAMAAGSTGYFIIVTNVTTNATDGHTVLINGATNPVAFNFTAAPVLINNQSNASGAQTIQAADITLVSSAVAAGNIIQGTNNNLVYVAQLTVATADVSVNNVLFTLGGTYDGNDLATVLVYFNPAAPTFAGSNFLGSAVATFAAPHSYSINFSSAVAMAAGSTGYFLILTNVAANATDGNTVLINGATNPVAFNFTTSPNTTNNQTNASGPQTIQAADVTLVSSPVAAGNINQGTNNNLIHVAQLTVATADVSVNNVLFTLGGTYDGNDLATVLVYFNSTAPTFAGSTFLGSAVATFAAPHSYSINFSSAVAMAAGSTGYFLILTNVAANATDGNTVLINGATNPVAFNFTTSPNITNNQTNASGPQTIQAADITLSTSPVATNTFMPGTNNNIVYIAQMAVATGPVTVDNVQFSLAGTHDANDLETVLVYFNTATPTFSGSIFLGSAVATFAAPHTYSINIAGAPVMAVGSTGYFLILVNVAPASTAGNTVLINGASNPVIFSFITSPNIINNQTNNGGLHTLPVNLISINAISKNTGVEVEWKVGDELNVDKYIVQKSVGGNSFVTIGTVTARGGSNTTTGYQFVDANPSAGNNFYRVQVLNMNGKIEYSPVVKIKLAGGYPGIFIYPNPVLNTNRLNLSLQYLKTGTYSFSLFNSDGQRVAAKTIYHAGGNSTQAFGLPALAAGTYRIELRGSNQRFIQSLIVE